MRRKIFFAIIFFLLIFVLIVGLVKKENEIEIGFVGALSGKYSNLGHDTLNGLLLAFENVNNEINGKKIKVIIRDDMQNADFANQAIDFFMANGINLIVGNNTSSMTKISLDKISKDNKTFLISPSASSSEFSNKDDNFFRLQIAQSEERFNLLSKYLLKNNIKNLYAIYDMKNNTYSNSYLNNFENSFVSNGGNKFLAKTTINKNFEKILEDIKIQDNIDGFFIVANSLDAARFVQFLKINNINKKVVVSGWSKSKDFIEDGGKAVEGTIFLGSYDENSQEVEYLKFKEKYIKRYKVKPTNFSAQGYETGKTIIDILNKDSNIENFKKTLLMIKEFDGLQGKIYFNEFGDVKREQRLSIIKNNKYINIK